MLIKSGLIVAFFTLISRVFGLLRELFIASLFGTSTTADCVGVAFRFPNLFRRIFGEGALSAVFVPIFSKKLTESKEDAIEFSSEVYTLLLLTLSILTLILIIFMPQIMFLIAPGFVSGDEKFDLAVDLCRITTPYMIFVCIIALYGGILNTAGRFAAFAFVPVIMNVGIVIFTNINIFSLPTHYEICIALCLAGLAQIIFMLFCMKRAGFSVNIKTSLNQGTAVKKLLRKMTPAALSSGAQQLNLFISQSVASFISGAVSILSYADRLYQLPLSLIGVTFGTILLPELSKIYKTDDTSKANVLQNKALRIAFLITLPATFGLLSLSLPIIHIIYQRGNFTWEDTMITSSVLDAYIFGLPAFIFAKIITPLFYANEDTKTPFKITLISLVINTVLNIILMMKFGTIGIAVGSSIAAWINTLLLYLSSKKHIKFIIEKNTIIFAFKAVLSSIIMFLSIKYLRIFFEPNFYSQYFIIKAVYLCLTILVGAITYSICSVIFGMHRDLY